jgi:hemerythrin-like domain-containing protein
VNSTDSLRRDHLLIEKMINALKIVSSMLREGRSIPSPILRQAIEFSINFTNVCHHGKEEDSLFPALEKKGMPKQGGPIARMLYEHEVTNNLANAIVASAESYLQGSEANRLFEDIDKYVEHVQMHLTKENQRLFVMADMILSDQSQEMDQELDVVEKTKLGDLNQSRQYYERIVDDLTKISN